MTAQRSIDSAFELVTIGMQHMRALIKGQTDGAITAVIDVVAGSLVGKQIDMDVMRNGIFKQIDNISVICDRNRFFSPQGTVLLPQTPRQGYRKSCLPSLGHNAF